MSGPMRLTDDLIRAALTPADDVRVPLDLATGIRSTIDATPQRRAPLLAVSASPRQRLLLQLAVLALLALAVGAIAIVGSQHRELPAPLGVTTYHGDLERNGVMPGPGPVGRPVREWSTAVGGPIGAGSPVVVGGTVFVGDENGVVTALAETTGDIEWRHSVGAPINDGLSVGGGLVLVDDDAGIVHALEIAADGRQRWQVPIGGKVQSAPVISDGTVYAGSTSGLLIALDLATGERRWPAVQTPGPISRSIAFANGVIYVGSGGPSEAQPGTLVAYAARDGTELWHRPLTRGDTSTVSLSGGRVFVTAGLDGGGPADHRLYGFDAATGAPVWKQPFPAPTRTTLLICAVAGGFAFACGDDGQLYALDPATGTVAWSLPIHSTQSPNGGYVAGVLYITSDDRNVHVIDVAARREIWPIPATGLPSAPTIIDGRIIVGTNLGQVESFAAPASSLSSPTPSGKNP